MALYEVTHPARVPRAGFDATVAQDESGTHTTIGAALASGAASILVRNGTYMQAADLVVPPYVFLVGETLGRVVIHFGGGPFSLKIASPSHGLACPGTVALAFGSAALVGAGTDFTKYAPGYVLNIRGVAHTLAAVADATHATLAAAYVGMPFAGAPYRAGVPAGADILANLVVAGSATYGVQLLSINDSGLSQVLVTACAGGFLLDGCGIVYLRNSLVRGVAGVGVRVANCHSCKVAESAIDGAGGAGVEIADSRLITLSECRVRQGAGAGVTVARSLDIHLQDLVIAYQAGAGVTVDAESTVAALSNCTVRGCGGLGLDAAGGISVEGSLFDGCGARVAGGSDLSASALQGAGATLTLTGADVNVHGCRVAGDLDLSAATGASVVATRVGGALLGTPAVDVGNLVAG